MHNPGRRPHASAYIPIIAIAVTTLVVFAVASLLAVLVRTVTTSTIPFDVDEANHALNAWEVYHAFGSRMPQAVYRAVVDQGFYPPVHSFFVAAAYALAGPSLAASRMPTVIHFAIVLALLAVLTFRLSHPGDRRNGAIGWLALLGAAWAVACAITSSIFVTNAVLIMLEMTGATVGLLLLLGADFLDRENRSRVAEQDTEDGVRDAGILYSTSRIPSLGLVVVALLAMLTALTKYSFGLFFLPALLLGLVTADWPWNAGRRAWDAVIVLAVYALFGGLWFLITDRTTMMLFFTDHPQYAPMLSSENLLYHVRLWLNGYTASAGTGVILVILAVVGAIYEWRWLAVRVAVWTVVAGLFVLTVSTTDEPRHFLPLAPVLWMLAGVGLVVVLRRLLVQRNGERVVIGFVLLLLAVIGVGARQEVLALSDDLVSEFEGVPVHTGLYDFALRNVDLTRPVLFIGDLYDQNNLLAIRWQAATLAGRSTSQLDIDYFPFEQYEHSLMRTNRKMQIASADPSFPRRHMNEVLAYNHYAFVVEIKDLKNYYGPRSANPEDPLCAYPARAREAAGWIVIVYDLDPGKQGLC